MWKGKRNGYDMNLYRSDRQRWIAGVCGGIAENTGWPVWLVRLGAFMLFTITGSFAFFAYIAAIIMLDRRDDISQGRAEFSSAAARAKARCTGKHRQYTKEAGLKDKVFNYGQAPSGKVKDLADRLKDLDGRLQAMETHVTSRKFQFDQELKRS